MNDTVYLTLGEYADSLAEIACLAISTSSVLEHAYNEAEFAEKTVLQLTIRGYMRLRKLAYG